MFDLYTKKIEHKISATMPKSKLNNITDDKKADVLISLVSSLRSDHISWIDRSYKAATWSIGIILSAVAYSVLKENKLSPVGIYYIAISIFLFGLLTHMFFLAARSAHRGIGTALVRCEAILRLCESNSYVDNQTFFGYSGEWVPPTHLTVLQLFHAVVMILSIVMVIFAGDINSTVFTQ